MCRVVWHNLESRGKLSIDRSTTQRLPIKISRAGSKVTSPTSRASLVESPGKSIATSEFGKKEANLQAEFEMDEIQYYDNLKALKATQVPWSYQNQEILNFLNKIEDEEKEKKEAMQDCTDVTLKAQFAQEYSAFNGKIQLDLKKMMQRHKKELDGFTFKYHIA